MVVASTVQRVSYDGDGTTINWPITFAIDGIESTEIVVYKVSTAGIATLLTSNYEVDLDVPEVVYPTTESGAAVLVGIVGSTPAEGIIILRKLDYKQEIDLKNRGPIPAETLEKGYDRATYMIQQLAEEVNRSVKAPITETESPEYATLLADAATAATAKANEAAASAVDAAAQVVLAAAEADAAETSANQAAASADTVKEGRIAFIIDGVGTTIAAASFVPLELPACTLKSWTLIADISGAIKIDVWKDVYANYPPTNADSITNGHEPEIAASGTKATDIDLSDWTDVTVDEGDVIIVNVDSCTSITKCTFVLKYERT